MQKEITFRRFWSRNSYLPFIAALLITFSFIIDNYWSGNSSAEAVKKTLQNYIQQQEKEIDELVTDTASMNAISRNNYDGSLLLNLTQKRYFFYQYFVNDIGTSHLVFWNTQVVEPPSSILDSPAKAGFIQLKNGYYVWKKAISGNNISIALIPVKWNYIITNEYLQNTFAIGKDIDKNYAISLLPAGATVRSAAGNILFYVTKRSGIVLPRNNIVSILFRILAVVLILLFIHFCAVFIAVRNKLWKSIVFLGGSILLLRLAGYYFPVPLNFRQFELFDPAIYGSNAILRSLGDLLINALLFTWLILFIRHQLLEKQVVVKVRNKTTRTLLMVIITVFFLAATFSCAQIIRSLVADSQISFDVINFFTLTVYSVTGFVVLCCLAIGYFILTQVLLFLYGQLFRGRTAPVYLAVAIGGLIYLSWSFYYSNAGFEIVVLAWLIVYLFLMTNYQTGNSAAPARSFHLVFWLFFFSVSITTVIVTENSRKDLLHRQHYAETLATKSDPSSERLMNTLLTDFQNDFLAINFHRFKSDTANRFLKDSLVNSNFSGYTSKYDTKIYSFDADEKALYNLDAKSYNELNTLLNTQSRPTSIADLYYYDEAYDRFSYISRKKITDVNDSLLGYIFILANPQKNGAETISPELFSKGHNNSIDNSPVYAFAIYNNGQLLNSHNDYPFATKLNPLQVPKLEFSIYNRNNYEELWYKAGPQKVVVIARKDNSVIEAITLFSYLFCAFLLITGLFWFLNVFIGSRMNRRKFSQYWQPSIRSQIHGTIIFISILSFLVIGVATILFFIARYENNNREKLSVAIRVTENEVRNSLADLSIFDDVISIYDPNYRAKLEKMIIKIAEIHADDINLYDLDGNLQVSSLPLPYNKGIVSNKMDPEAFYHLNRLKEVQFFKQEKIGRLSYISNYVPVIDETGREYAYLNIPYFTSQTKLKDEIANFLVTIINLNAFIFLIAGIVALFITNRITRSFALIGEKMKAVNLGRLNEAINWNRNDEIGELVKEYNRMVGKLDESAAALAKSEREGAWREMARQVAHEIKNPLTPMKLSLQYLQKAISNNAGNVNELTAKVSQTLVEQIDHLNQIAGEFSQFANIGNPRNELFDLHDLLRPLVQLYSIEERIQMNWDQAPGDVSIFADRTHINRLFTNLIQNALQSVAEGQSAKIEINEQADKEKILVKVTDNGVGIAEDIQSKIFTPNFTTKTSGTGLGLAMCKGIVEQAGGRIWFETESGKGSSFFVELPVVRK